MTFDSIGPLARGSLAVHQESEKQKQLEFKVQLPRAKGEDEDEDEDAEREAAARRAVPFNPHVDALRTVQELDRGRKIVSAIESSPPLALLRGKEEERDDVGRLGMHFDVMA